LTIGDEGKENPAVRPSSATTDVRTHAADNLRFIREAMESAAAFTAVSGWGQVVVGATALAAAALASRQATPERWLAVWLGEALIAVAISAVAMAMKSRRRALPLFSGGSRRFWPGFAAPVVVGALLTGALFSRGLFDLMPAAWLLLFGAAVVAGGVVSVPLVRAMGWSFVALGVVALFTPMRYSDALLAAGFGGLLAGFGVAIARRHGG
jgi:hypothetical protein